MFDDWWYIRFLLPALPVVIVFCVAIALAAFPRGRAFAALALCLVLVPWHLSVARARQVFDLQSLESRFRIAGEYAAATLPPGAVVLSVQQSGSLRYHGRRATIAWDAIAADALDATIAQLRAAGRPPYIALEDEEEARFPRAVRGAAVWRTGLAAAGAAARAGARAGLRSGRALTLLMS